MSRLHKDFFGQLAVRMLTLLLLSTGLTLTALSALLPGQALWPALVGCAFFSVCLGMFLSLPFRIKYIPAVLGAGGLILWGLAGGGPVFTLIQLCKAAFLSVNGVENALAPYGDAARIALCLIFVLASAGLIWDEYLSLATFLTAAITGLAFVLGRSEKALLYCLPAAAALIMMTPPEQKKRLIALPVAAAIALSAYLLTPAAPQAQPEMEKAAQDIRNLIEDYLIYDDYRDSFSLAQTGFQPLETKLGGPAQPGNTPVMEVKTDRLAYLRGKAYDTYTGLSWLDTLSQRRYLYQSPRYEALRNDTLDLDRPLAGTAGMQEQSLHIHLLSPGSTTLFAPQRTRSLEMESQRMVLYYNLGSELFITRDTAAGDSYSLRYLPLTPEDQDTLSLVEACQGLTDASYQDIAATFLALPGHIQQEIKDLTRLATANAQTPYEKALAIETFLRTHYRYDLNVDAPPDNVDFIAWFLIGQRRGYCTYFASAMTVMCRLAGVPARYVTGYIAAPDENGMAYVTEEHAHAWTEVYLNGFGWLTFDATPRSDNGRQGQDGNQPRQQEREQEQDNLPPTQPPSGNQPTEMPTNQPQEQPTEAPTNQPSENPSQQPGPSPSPAPDSAQPTDTPPPYPSPSPDPAANPGNQQRNPPPYWLLGLLIPLLALSLILLRYYRTEPLRHARRQPSQAPHIYFSAILLLLSLQGLRRQPQETLHDFAQRAEDALPQGPALLPLADAYAAHVYGPAPIDPLPLESAYLTIRSAASPLHRLMAAVKRIAGIKA